MPKRLFVCNFLIDVEARKKKKPEAMMNKVRNSRLEAAAASGLLCKRNKIMAWKGSFEFLVNTRTRYLVNSALAVHENRTALLICAACMSKRAPAYRVERTNTRYTCWPFLNIGSKVTET